MSFFSTILGNFRQLNVLKIKEASIFTATLRLHHTLGIFLFLSASLSTFFQAFGSPIHCLARGFEGHLAFMEAFCWFHGTFTIDENVHRLDPYPGVKKFDYEKGPNQDYEGLTRHTYYQWIGVVLCLQSLAFYSSYGLWKYMERGLTAKVVKMSSDSKNKHDEVEADNPLIKYLIARRGANGWWAVKYIICEVVAFLNVIVQAVLMDYFFQGAFSNLGIKVLKHDYSILNYTNMFSEPLLRLFPRVTKCYMEKFVLSGHTQGIHGLCQLPLNVLNEKIYIIFWVLLIIAFVWSFVSLGFLITCIFSPNIRAKSLKLWTHGIPNEVLSPIANFCDFGDWFLLTFLLKNLDPITSRSFLEAFSGEARKHLNGQHRSNYSSTEESVKKDRQRIINVYHV